jgi:glyoxylate/hydroxypyruvate reductase A
MNVLLCGELSAAETEAWREALTYACGAQTHWWNLAQARAQPEAVEVAVVANPAPGSLQGLPRLRLIQSLWAGVDRLMADDSLPSGIPLARMVDPAMTQAMVETALWAVLSLHRGFFTYARQQAQGLWRWQPQRRADEVAVCVLGQGTMGAAVSQALRERGYRVSGWRRSDGADALQPRLADAEILVNLLPLTPATRGLIDARFLAALPRGASLVNLARGAHVVEADLLAALDNGQITHAVLDVFQTEPLPAGHAFWRHAAVTVLPHAAAATDARSAAAVVADNLQRLQDGTPLRHLVDRGRGY